MTFEPPIIFVRLIVFWISFHHHTDSHSSSSEMWLYQTLDDMDSRLRRAHKDEILSCLHSIPSHLRPQYSTRSIRACRTPLLLHIQSRIWYLHSLSNHSFFQVLFSIFPFHNNTSLSRDALTAQILSAEYGDGITHHLREPSLSKLELSSLRRQEKKDAIMTEEKNNLMHISSSWPTLVPDDVVFKCLEQYRVHSIWKQPVVCCVCGLLRPKVDLFDVYDGYTGALNFSILQSKDPHIIDVSPFQYGCNVINNTILCKDGMSFSKEKKIILNICTECHCALKKKKNSSFSARKLFIQR